MTDDRLYSAILRNRRGQSLIDDRLYSAILRNRRGQSLQAEVWLGKTSKWVKTADVVITDSVNQLM